MKKTSILIVLLLWLPLGAGGVPPQSGYDLFQKALMLERADGKLQEAITLYRKVENESRDKSLAAKAQLHIGLCSEKLGMQNAQKEYQKVIDSYPEFQQEVVIAKDRLSQLAKLTRELEEVPSKPTFTKIQFPTSVNNATLSPDGNKIVSFDNGELWVTPVHGKVSPDIGGEPVRLPGTERVLPLRPALFKSWSGDGKWITFPCGGNNGLGICIVPSSGGKAKMIVNLNLRIISSTNLGVGDLRSSLSPDGKMLAFVPIVKGEIKIFTIPVEGGDEKQLTEAWSSQPAFSPDGEKIAYVKYKSLNEKNFKKSKVEGNLQSNVWVIPATGGPPVQVSDLPGRATGPIWSPDGEMIAFLRRQRDEKTRICIVPVSETGTPKSSPTQIELPLNTNHFLSGWTSDNRIGVVLTNPDQQAIYTVPATGGLATQVSPQIGQGLLPAFPRWSPDGERLYFGWSNEEGQLGIASAPSEGGKISFVYKAPFPPPPDTIGLYGGFSISPDGEKIVFSGLKIGFGFDLYTIPVQGGELTKITGPYEQAIPFSCWSPDGKSIAFFRFTEDPKENNKPLNNIFIVPTEGGKVRQLTSESHQVFASSIAWSPDGKWIAYFSEDQAIKVIPVQGGASREVVKVEDVNIQSDMAWSQDSKKIAYTSNGEIWLVSLDGGKPEKIETGSAPNIDDLSWSPDGNKFAFSAKKTGSTDLWFLEDFLPLDKLATK